MPSISITAAAVGAAGALGSSMMSSSASSKAAQQSMTGYNYLTAGQGAPTIRAAQAAGVAAGPQQTAALGGESAQLGKAGNTQDTINALLTGGPDSAAANTGFQNYLKSTGYNFQLDTGSRAITGNAASKGLLNSGSTAKALTTFGNNLATQSFGNYLNQLGNLGAQQGSLGGAYGNLAGGYGNQVATGLNAVTNVGNAGTGAGSAAAQYTQAGGNTMASGITALTAQTQNILPFLMGSGG